MSYRCEICQQVMPPRTPATKVVLVIRPRIYPYRMFAYHGKRHGSRWGGADRGGTGFEIVKEATACPQCAAAYHDHCPQVLRE